MQKIKIIDKVKILDDRNSFIQCAFTAWLMGSGGDMKFNEYIKQLGLVETSQLTQIQKGIMVQMEKKKALSTAQQIIEADKRRKSNGR